MLPIESCGAGGNIGGHGVMQHRTLDSYMESIKQGQLPIAMMTKQSSLEPIFSTLKAGFDSGVVRRSTFADLYGARHVRLLEASLFSHWEKEWSWLSFQKIIWAWLLLAASGALSLAQSVIQVLNAEYQMHPAPKASGSGVHPHASFEAQQYQF